jgi:nucleotide-binding universal stress UspA family protein
MTTRRHIVCAVDFSESARGALHAAAVLAERFHSVLTVATVDDPLLASFDVGRLPLHPGDHTRHSLQRMVAETLGHRSTTITIDYIVGVGRPAAVIIRVSR